jgi:hypothetical protein
VDPIYGSLECPLAVHVRVEKVTVINGAFFACTCGHWERWQICCPHVFAVRGYTMLGDCGFRWTKMYDFYAYHPDFPSLSALVVSATPKPGPPYPAAWIPRKVVDGATPTLGWSGLTRQLEPFPFAASPNAKVDELVRRAGLIHDDGVGLLWRNGRVGSFAELYGDIPEGQSAALVQVTWPAVLRLQSLHLQGLLPPLFLYTVVVVLPRHCVHSQILFPLRGV